MENLLSTPSNSNENKKTKDTKYKNSVLQNKDDKKNINKIEIKFYILYLVIYF